MIILFAMRLETESFLAQYTAFFLKKYRGNFDLNEISDRFFASEVP